MAAKKETETQKTTGRKQTDSKRPSASSAKKTSSAPRGNEKGQQKKKESIALRFGLEKSIHMHSFIAVHQWRIF